jgi:hypothetical protein
MHINESGYKSYVANVNIPAGTAVKLSGGKVVASAAATDLTIGTIHADAKANQAIDVRLRSAQGTLNIVAGGAIAVGDAVTANASGLGVATTTTGNHIIGYALEAVSSGAWVELLPTMAKY